MFHPGDIDHKRDVSISILANSIYYYIDTCFIMELPGAGQVKNRYRLLAFHEDQRKIFVDKYYQTLKGARIAFNMQFKNLAYSDEVSPVWTELYQPDQDWIDEMLSIVENLEFNYNFKGTDYVRN